MLEKIRIPNSKGQQLAAAIHRPEKNTGKLAILCAGYLDSKDYAGLVNLAEELCARGYAVVRFDATGIWESGGDISEYTTTQYLADVKSVLEYMLAQESCVHVLLGGHSRGGQVSLLFAARDPRISAVVGIMPSSSRSITSKDERLKKWEETGSDVSNRDLPSNPEQKIEFKVPYSHLADRGQYDVLADVKNVRVPVLLLTGELETIVLPEYVQEIYDNANEPKKFVIVPGVGHDYRHNPEGVKKVNAAVVRGLEELKVL